MNMDSHKKFKSQIALMMPLKSIVMCDILLSCGIMNNLLYSQLASWLHNLESAAVFPCSLSETRYKPTSCRDKQLAARKNFFSVPSGEGTSHKFVSFTQRDVPP